MSTVITRMQNPAQTIKMFFVLVLCVTCVSLISRSRQVFLRGDNIQALESRLAYAGISARYDTDVCITQPADLGQGFILKTSGQVTQNTVQIIKTVIEDFFREKDIDAYEWVQVVPEPGSGSIQVIQLNYAKPTDVIERGGKKASKAQLSHFEGNGIAFDYPSVSTIPQKPRFDIDKVREMQRPYGIELIMLVMSPDEKICMQLARSKKETSFDALHKEKRTLAEEINKSSVSLTGDRSTKFTVDTVQLSGDTPALREYGEKPNGEVAITYEFLKDGYDYTLMFIYKAKNLADSEKQAREQVVRSVKITASASHG